MKVFHPHIIQKVLPKFGQKRKHNAYDVLQKKWTKRQEVLERKLYDQHPKAFEWIAQKLPKKEHITHTALTGLLLLASPNKIPVPNISPIEVTEAQKMDDRVFLLTDLSNIVPHDVRPLTTDEEKSITTFLSNKYQIPVLPEMHGIRLNQNYGLIGQEQHLARFPGDTMNIHFDTAEEAQKYAGYGMAPGLGAYGYFARSHETMTDEQNEMEKYYIAVPTFLSPGFNENVKKYNDFFKFHKMLVVNPQNGKAMVVVIGDSGPAPFTGKQLGGSPEVMRYLERFDGKQKGPVLYFFIDDPNDTIPLGPINPVSSI